MNNLTTKLIFLVNVMLARKISPLAFTITKKILTIIYFSIEGIVYSIQLESFIFSFPIILLGSLGIMIAISIWLKMSVETILTVGYLTEFILFVELVFLKEFGGDSPNLNFLRFISLGFLLKNMDSPLQRAKAKLISRFCSSLFFLIRVFGAADWLGKGLLTIFFIVILIDYLWEKSGEQKITEEKNFIKTLSRQAKIGSLFSKKAQSNALMIDPSSLLIRKKSIVSSVVSLVKKGSPKATREYTDVKSDNLLLGITSNILNENREWINFFISNFVVEEVDNTSILTVKPSTKTSFEQYLINLCDLVINDRTFNEKFSSSEEIAGGRGFLRDTRKNSPGRSIKFKIYISYDDEESRFPMLILILKDRTIKKENEKLKSFDEFKDKLLATVVHDMRAPLSMVLSTIEASRRCKKVDELKENLKMAEINSKLLDCLIADILDYSLFKENRLNLVCKQFTILPVLEESMSLIKLQAKHKNIELRIVNNLPEEKLIYSDQRRLKQVLINLLTNSIKFTTTGAITLKVESACQNKDSIMLEVSDTGSGIKKENLDKLGEAFATFDVPEGLNKQGIGLGLYISKSIISQLGPWKNFLIKSEEGKGTSFSFLLFQDIRNDPRSENQNLEGFLCNPSFCDLNKGRAKKNKTSLGFRTDSFSQKLALSERSLSADLSSNELDDDTKIPDISFHINRIRQKNPFTRGTVEHDSYNFINHSFMIQNTSSIGPRNFRTRELNLQSDKELSFISNSSKALGTNLKNLNSLNVLIADDDIFSTFVLETLLKKVCREKIHINKASDGAQALHLFEYFNKKPTNNPLQIIFMDCLMPILDGYKATNEITHLIRDSDKYEPVIVAGLTAMVCNDKEKNKCFESGMDFIFQKPITDDTLIEFLKDYIS